MTTEIVDKPKINYPGRVITTILKEEVINDLVKEVPQREIASKFGVTQGNISHIKKANEDKIEAKQQEIIDELPTIVETIKTDIDTNKKISSDLNKDYESATSRTINLKSNLDKTNVNVLKIARILDTNTIQFGDDNSQHVTVISASYQKFIDFQNDRSQDDNKEDES